MSLRPLLPPLVLLAVAASAAVAGDRILEPETTVTALAHEREAEAEAAFALGDYDSYRATYLDLRRDAERSGDLDLLARSHRNLANVERRQGRFDAAGVGYRSALALYQQLGQRDGEADILTQLGLVHLNQGQYVEALQVLDRSLQLQDSGARAERDRTLHYLGLLYRQLQQPEEARKLLEAGLEIAVQSGDQGRQAAVLGSLARVANDSGDGAAALAFAARSRVINQRTGSRPGMAYDSLERGRVLLLLERWQDAREALEESIDRSLELGQQPSLADARAALGRLEWHEGNATAAHALFETALDHYQLAQDLPRIVDVQRRLLPVLAQLGEFERALDLGVQALANQERLVSERLDRSLTLLEFRRRAEEDARRIELLLRDNEVQGLRLRQDELTRYLGIAIAAALLLLLIGLAFRYRQVDALSRRLAGANQKLDAAHRELTEKAEALYRRSITDPLTGLSNRRHVFDGLENLLAEASGQGEDLAILLIDVDHFKRINDRHGHAAGDEVLKHVARVLSRNFHAHEPHGRIGGEEFLAAIPGTAAGQALSRADQLRRDIGEIEPSLPRVTASIGVAWLKELPRAGLSELLEAADQALYRAKEAGRDRVMTSRGKSSALLH